MLSQLAFIILLIGFSQRASAAIRGTPASGSCLCTTASSLNIRNSACNHIGSITSGQCYKYTGSTKTCVVSGKSYTLYKISYGSDAWAAGDYMDVSSSSRCPGQTGGASASTGTGSAPPAGSCLCPNTDNLNLRNSACNRIGSLTSRQCYTYAGSTKTCVVSGTSYTFVKINHGNDAWAALNYLEVSSQSRCSSSSAAGGRDEAPTSGTYYACEITDAGKRVHEQSTRQPSVECLDRSCGNTCKGGQCVAYVVCRCRKNGRQPPVTSCWRPGQKVTLPDGKCNRAIPRGTAIATFNSTNRYYGHAAVFVECENDYTIKVYDQSCQHPVRYTSFSSTRTYYRQFAVITSPGCSDRAFSCRVETSGPNECPSYRDYRCR